MSADTPSEADVIRMFLAEFAGNLHTCLPGYVLSYSRAMQTADVQPAVRGRMQAAVVIDNPTSAIVTTGGVTMDPHSLAVVVYPSTITVDQAVEVVTAIYKATPAGIATNGAESGTVIGADGLTKTVYYAFASTVAVSASIVVTPETGYSVADVTPGIEAVFADYALTLTVGSLVSRLDLVALVATVAGVKSVTYGSFLLAGVAADYQANNVQVPVLGVPTVT